MALTEIILMFDTITVEDIINYMKDSLTATKSTKSQVSYADRVKLKDTKTNEALLLYVAFHSVHFLLLFTRKNEMLTSVKPLVSSLLAGQFVWQKIITM